MRSPLLDTVFGLSVVLTKCTLWFNRAAQTSLSSQPKAAALSSEGTVFVAEGSTVEAFRSNQRVADLKVKYEANGVATTGGVVAVGGDVSLISLSDVECLA